MIDFDSITFNELISRRIMTELAGHDPSFAGLEQDQVPNRVTRFSFMAAIAKINGLPFFPKIAEFCDASLHKYCDSTVMTRGFFAPLCMSGENTLIVATANPWSPLAEEYLAPRFPDLEIVKVVTLASEISRAIESVATNNGPSRSELEAIDVEDIDDGIHDFDVTTPGISGRFTISYFHRPIDIRYERHRTYRGYHLTMRLLDKSNINVKLGKGTLAFDDETMFALNKVMKIPVGIIVMSGPTGSGKSTTLNAILRELNRPEVNILTLENPVQDEVPGITHCDLKSPKEFKPRKASFPICAAADSASCAKEKPISPLSAR